MVFIPKVVLIIDCCISSNSNLCQNILPCCLEIWPVVRVNTIPLSASALYILRTFIVKDSRPIANSEWMHALLESAPEFSFAENCLWAIFTELRHGLNVSSLAAHYQFHIILFQFFSFCSWPISIHQLSWLQTQPVSQLMLVCLGLLRLVNSCCVWTSNVVFRQGVFQIPSSCFCDYFGPSYFLCGLSLWFSFSLDVSITICHRPAGLYGCRRIIERQGPWLYQWRLV